MLSSKFYHICYGEQAEKKTKDKYCKSWSSSFSKLEFITNVSFSWTNIETSIVSKAKKKTPKAKQKKKVFERFSKGHVYYCKQWTIHGSTGNISLNLSWRLFVYSFLAFFTGHICYGEQAEEKTNRDSLEDRVLSSKFYRICYGGQAEKKTKEQVSQELIKLFFKIRIHNKCKFFMDEYRNKHRLQSKKKKKVFERISKQDKFMWK